MVLAQNNPERNYRGIIQISKENGIISINRRKIIKCFEHYAIIFPISYVACV